MRSFLFVPGDSPQKLRKAITSGADALIVDLEDSVAASAKALARRMTLAFLGEWAREAPRPRLYVRINALSTGLAEADLDAAMTGAPDGIVLPKAESGADVALLSSRLAVREALHDLPDFSTRILAIATETPAALFGLGTYRGASARLDGLAWGGEDLSAALGAGATKHGDGGWTEPFRLARNLCLFGAAAACVPAVDTVFTDFRDLKRLRREAEAAARDGFSAKLAIHPAQVPVINEAFTPGKAEVERARRVLAAFEAAGSGAGVLALDGEMIDRPHLLAARRVLARAGEGGGAGG